MNETFRCPTCGGVATVSLDKGQPSCGDCAREELYARTCGEASDINEHLPLLRELASRCEHVTEFGLRWARGSTVAFLAAQPKTLVSWDLEPKHVISDRVQQLLHLTGKTSFEPRVGDTLKIRIETTDLLFIDTLHTARQLLAELERHVDPKDQAVRKYLIFHDTKTFGLEGEDRSTPGLRTAIRQFQKYFAFPLWKLKHVDGDEKLRRAAAKGLALQKADGFELLDLENNNGLLVLEHVCADGHSPDRVRDLCTWCGKVPR